MTGEDYLGHPAVTSSVKALNFARSEDFRKALLTQGMKGAQAFTLRVTGKIKIPLLHAGKFEFTIISDGVQKHLISCMS